MGREPHREQLLQNLLKERIPGVEIKNLSPILDPLRVVKTVREIEQLRKAGRLSALALIEAIKTTEPGVWEWELDAVARYMFYVGGAQGLGYRSITASGPNINNGHYYRNNRRLHKDDMMLMDFAPDVGYYTSDIGRMWPVDGTYPPFMRELYGFVVEYHKIVLDVLRPGETVEALQAEVQEKAIALFEGWSWSKDIYKAAAKRMVDTGGGSFSHGVGMAVHDIGSYRRMGELQPGMVFSIDPQMWVPEENLYIRIEDTIAIREGGHQNLTGLAPMELDEIEELMKEDGMLQQLAWAIPVPNPAVTKPPASLNTDPFYQKYLSAAGGIPVLSSRQVSDGALTEAAYLMGQMLQNRPDVVKAMIERDVRVVVMAPTEMTTDVPEQRNMSRPEFWDRRARGLGGRITSCGEENLLTYPWDRYIGENILIHEFAHCIAGYGLRHVDADFQSRLQTAYDDAKAKGLWANTYAMSNSGEYWAEAVQSYFDCNRSSDPPNGVHNHIDTREELAEYDPTIYKLIEDSLGKIEWRYVKPTERR
ncbi:MAG: M24 family metallopeptidase [Armatimonadetes bacterium]|nr:M24 family metallopeptidase [Armatimonadota bacterium]